MKEQILLPQRTEVTVIGGGVSGMAIAGALARRGIETLLLEREALGAGASRAMPGHLFLGLVDPYNRIVTALGEARAAEIWAISAENRERVRQRVSPLRKGLLALAQNPHELREFEETLPLLSRHPFPVELWDEKRAQAASGSPRVIGGLYDPEGIVIDPILLLGVLAKEAREAGARLLEGVEVEAIESTVHDLRLSTPHGKVRTEIVVIATNGYARRLHPFFGHAILPRKGQCLRTRPLPPVTTLGLHANFGSEAWFQDEGGRIVLGSLRWFEREGEARIWNPQPAPRMTEGMITFLRDLHPGAGEIALERVEVGIMGFSCDGLPLVGPLPGAPRIVSMAGFCGRGFGFALACAEALAGMIETGRIPPSCRLFSPRRLTTAH
ncbi:MAG: FAD-binding oxidoreductase [Deltaproteobacteria bacterium]|nr:MAG: FAD-binding oxidoreductase [Deltaproteobacteria bacterium]